MTCFSFNDFCFINRASMCPNFRLLRPYSWPFAVLIIYSQYSTQLFSPAKNCSFFRSGSSAISHFPPAKGRHTDKINYTTSCMSLYISHLPFWNHTYEHTKNPFSWNMYSHVRSAQMALLFIMHWLGVFFKRVIFSDVPMLDDFCFVF